MHIKINFISNRDIILPIHYNHIIQGFIYKNIDRQLAEFLHDCGYIYKDRNFKLFTFSRILEKGDRISNIFNFNKNISFIVSSPIDVFCRSLANSILQNDDLLLGQNHVKADQIQIKNNIVDREEITVRTLSPIVAYSTLFRADGSKYTCYFMPGEPDYERIISDNSVKKYNAFNNTNEVFEKGISIRPLGSIRQNLINYKNFIIKGVSGKFLLSGDKQLLQMALDAGLGSKNAQGFGYITPE